MKSNIRIKNQRLNISFWIMFVMLISTAVLSSCDGESEFNIKIQGDVVGIADRNIVLEAVQPTTVDTVGLFEIDEQGHFEIELDGAKNGFYRLIFDSNNIIYLYLKDGDVVSIDAKYPEVPRHYSISGSDDCSLLQSMNVRLIESSDKLNELKKLVKEASLIPDYNMDSLWNATNDTARRLYDADKKYLMGFINSNKKSPVIFMALYQYIGTSPILMLDQDLDVFKQVLQDLKDNNPELPHANYLESEITKQEQKNTHDSRDYVNLNIGVEAPDFSLPNEKGERITLSRFLGSKVILCFWSSWNKPSVESLAQISKLAKLDNLKIVLVSVDTNKDKWLDAVSINKLNDFVNLCDFKSWEGAVTKIYAVKSVPSFVVVDEVGNIQALTTDVNDVVKDLSK